MSCYYVYVLLSKKDKKFYIGYTSNVHRRLIQHNSGLTKSTAPRRPFILLYYECHLSKQDALRRESYFKSSSGKRTLRQMLRESLTLLNYKASNEGKV